MHGDNSPSALADDLERLEGMMVRIEDHIFSGKERQMVKALSDVSKALLDMKQAIHHHGDILTELQKEGKKLFNGTFAESLKEVEGDWRTINYMIENQQEMLTELRETNNSLLSTKQNEVMKILTIMAFVTFPLSLLASIFGMNTDYLPLVGLPGDFWIIVAIMVILTGVFFAFFKYKKWL